MFPVVRMPSPKCVVNKIQQTIEAIALDLRGAVVLTEAATGPYVVTPIIAAMAGAKRVYAVTRDSRYGSIDEVTQQTQALAQAAGCVEYLQIVTEETPDIVAHADIITNSGHLRPIDREMVSWMKSTAVIPLMYEAWEFRPGDVDLAACHERGIPVAGTNEEHPTIGVFNYLGVMVIKQLLECQVEVWGTRILLLCNNRFAPYIQDTLVRCGADVVLDDTLFPASWRNRAPFDAVVVAITPRGADIIGTENALVSVEAIQSVCPGGPVIQLWGDIDRSALEAKGVAYHPLQDPGKGHMGGMLSDLGMIPVIRLQAGGLKVGEVMWRLMQSGNARRAVDAAVQTGYGSQVVGNHD